MSHWEHPAKAVFERYGVTLRKVVIDGRHPTFEVGLPFDPQTEPNEKRLDALLVDLLRANGQWAYSLAAPDDGIEYEVSRAGSAGKISIENHPYPSK